MAEINMTVLRGSSGGGGGGSGISLVGSPFVIEGSSEEYAITDFDSFSVYEVTVSEGSATILDNKITLVTPLGLWGSKLLCP